MQRRYGVGEMCQRLASVGGHCATPPERSQGEAHACEHMPSRRPALDGTTANVRWCSRRRRPTNWSCCSLSCNRFMRPCSSCRSCSNALPTTCACGAPRGKPHAHRIGKVWPACHGRVRRRPYRSHAFTQGSDLRIDGALIGRSPAEVKILCTHTHTHTHPPRNARRRVREQ